MPTLSVQPPSGSTFPLGVSTSSVTATDAAGNSPTQRSHETVRDTTAPTLANVPADMTIEATSNAGASVTYGGATATDLVSMPTVSYQALSGSTFPLGV